ncbi:MAG TPA: glycosyltransferase family 2 protein [Anaerolineae bacterium]|nr:glycosyltransferase family 2 protein [Anaerolineae bacterium]HMR67996.1 glycosyltransferase family 2 protein [Anaerolineae bacterium]
MSPSNFKISVIIPNINGRKHLEYCLPALLGQHYRSFEMVLVDNGSTDDSVEFTKRNFPDVKIIAFHRNLGFAEANNRAIQATTSPYLVTLNNDTRVEPTWLAEMVQAAEQSRDIGMVACKILYMQAPHLADSAGLAIDQVGMAWNRYNGLVDPNETEPYEVFCPAGAAALYKREMLDEIGLFDERYFAYCEDMDLGWRGRLMGWRCLYVPTATVYHHHSATSGQGSRFKRYLLTRNRIWTVLKNYPSPELWIHLPRLLFYDLTAAFYRLIKEKNLSPIQGRLAALRQLGPMLHQRRAIQSKRRLSSQALLALMSPSANLTSSVRVGRPSP